MQQEATQRYEVVLELINGKKVTKVVEAADAMSAAMRAGVRAALAHEYPVGVDAVRSEAEFALFG